MLDYETESKIIYTNSLYFNVDLLSMYKETGEKIAESLLKSFPNAKSYSIVLGLGGNAGDGISIALSLLNKVDSLNIFLIGRSTSIDNPITLQLWEELKIKSLNTTIKIKQDCYAEDVIQSDVNLECLVGTGLKADKLNKRFADVIKRISHFIKPLIAIDKPSPSYKADKTISLLYPKVLNAEIIEINLPKEISIYPGPGEVQAILKPKFMSHKSKNGKLLLINYSESHEEFELLNKISNIYPTQIKYFNFRNQTNNSIEELELRNYLDWADLILLGESNSDSITNKLLLNYILQNCKSKLLITPSAKEIIEDVNLTKLQEKLIIFESKSISSNTNESSFKDLAININSNIINLAVKPQIYSSTGDFRLDISNKLFNPDLRKLFIYLSAILSSKNDMWLSIRATNFLLTQIDTLDQIDRIGDIIENI